MDRQALGVAVAGQAIVLPAPEAPNTCLADSHPRQSLSGRASQCRGSRSLRLGDTRIDQAAAGALLAALTPAGVKAALRAAEELEADHDAALKEWRPQSARSVGPSARGSLRPGRATLRELAKAEAELARRSREAPHAHSARLRASAGPGAGLGRAWPAPSINDRDRRALLRALIDEVILDASSEPRRASVSIRWRGGALTELRFATHYDDGRLVGI